MYFTYVHTYDKHKRTICFRNNTSAKHMELYVNTTAIGKTRCLGVAQAHSNNYDVIPFYAGARSVEWLIEHGATLYLQT